MVGFDIESRLSFLAKRFEESRGGKSGREIRRYPAALWSAVAKLDNAGVPHATLCKRCGFAPGTLARALGRLPNREVREASEVPQRPAVKTLVVETRVAMPVTCEIVFPNGVVIRVDTAALDAALLERLRVC